MAVAAGHLWVAKDVVGADAAPDHVSVAGADLSAELEGCAVVGAPCQFPDARVAYDAFDTKLRPEPAPFQVLNE